MTAELTLLGRGQEGHTRCGRRCIARAQAQMEVVSSRQRNDLVGLSTPEVALAPHRWPQDFRTEYRSDFEKDDAELQTCVGARVHLFFPRHPFNELAAAGCPHIPAGTICLVRARQPNIVVSGALTCWARPWHHEAPSSHPE